MAVRGSETGVSLTVSDLFFRRRQCVLEMRNRIVALALLIGDALDVAGIEPAQRVEHDMLIAIGDKPRDDDGRGDEKVAYHGAILVARERFAHMGAVAALEIFLRLHFV